MKILVYEDSEYTNLYPLNMLRTCYELKCGANTILRRLEIINKDKYEITLHCRNLLSANLKENHKKKINHIEKDDYLLLNGKVIHTDDSIKYLLSKKEKNSCFKFKDTTVAAFITKDKIQLLREKVERTTGENVFEDDFFVNSKFKCINLKDNFDIRIINYPWDIINYIQQGGLNADLDYCLTAKKKFQKVRDKENFINHKKIFISKDVSLSPEVVLDASGGNIVIDENAKIEPFTFIKGPAYIGKNCLIKSGTRIYGPCVIGDYSRVSGEISRCILHSSVNKQHDGFTGDSYLCPFVNLGADTVTSNLKNNYSKIRAKLNGEVVNTGMQFLGSIIGDHSKTSINTMLNTGSIIGIFANLFGGGFHAKEIESFSWNEAGKSSSKYDIEKAIETAKTVMERRGIIMSSEYEKLVRSYS